MIGKQLHDPDWQCCLKWVAPAARARLQAQRELVSGNLLMLAERQPDDRSAALPRSAHPLDDRGDLEPY